jgi:multidrug efflux pump subunit AcrA (membrane-fusion protein)
MTENNNAQKTAPPLASAVETDQAQVEQAQATVDTDQTALDATSLTAPADGTVGAINFSVGQTVSAGTTTSGTGSSSSTSSATGTGSSSSSSSTAFLTLTNLTDLQVVADIDEADASKVTVGAPATVTLDAITGKEFAAHVIEVSSTSITSSNVVEYPVTFQIDTVDSEIKPGMTASVSVVTDKVDDALNVESAAVRTSGTTSYVLVEQPNGTTKQVDVVVGTKGDTTTQIIGNVKAGDVVTLPVSTVKATTTTTTKTTGSTGITGGLTGAVGGGFGGGGPGGGP